MPIRIKTSKKLHEYLTPLFTLIQCEKMIAELEACGIWIIKNIPDTDFKKWPDSILIGEIRLDSEGIFFNFDADGLTYADVAMANQICDIIKKNCLDRMRELYPGKGENDGGEKKLPDSDEG